MPSATLKKTTARPSMEGAPLYYFALVAQKTAKIPKEFLTACGIE